MVAGIANSVNTGMKINDFGANPTFWSIARTSAVRLMALKIAAIVGTILCVINHLPDFMHDTFGVVNLLQIVLTYAVPFCVSTYSSVKMIRQFGLSPNIERRARRQ